jgi:DNA processing protein
MLQNENCRLTILMSRRASRKVNTSDPKPMRESSYQPPTDTQVSVTTLGDLLGDLRLIVPDQQARLGYESEGLDMRLWCAGDTTLIRKRSVAIVGTRDVSEPGAARSRRLAKELSEEGIVVFSGLAKGVDTQALRSAIDTGGRVVAVIGTPLEKAYPAENKRLQEEIYHHHLLVSQFHPGQRVFPSHFPERNKLMAALSDATAIIEAGETSGTLHQAAECVRLKRWLFITQAVMNAGLAWPKKFENYEKFRVLKATEDVLNAIDVVKFETR